MENTNKIYRLAIIGPPNAGKGKQSGFICDTYGLVHLSTGDVLRKNVALETDVGKAANLYMSTGRLVPDEIILEVVSSVLPDLSQGIVPEILRTEKDRQASNKTNGFLLDGFPRTIPQAEYLRGNSLDVVISLMVPDDVVRKRSSGRRFTPPHISSTPRVYNIYNEYDLEHNIDLHTDSVITSVTERKTGILLVQRPDDAIDVVDNRLKVYHSQSDSVIEFYRVAGILAEINGVSTPEEVFCEIRKSIDISKR